MEGRSVNNSFEIERNINELKAQKNEFEYIRLDLRVFKDEVERNNVTKAEYLIHKHRYYDGSVYY